MCIYLCIEVHYWLIPINTILDFRSHTIQAQQVAVHGLESLLLL